jgi:hypothetical protein
MVQVRKKILNRQSVFKKVALLSLIDVEGLTPTAESRQIDTEIDE